MGMPWSMTSAKKFSLPNRSWNSPAARRASSYWPRRRRGWGFPPPPAGGPAGLVVLAEAQAGLDLAADAAGGGDEAVGVLRQQLAVDARLEVVALHRGQRAHPEQVVHAGGGPREQGHVGVGAAAADVV